MSDIRFINPSLIQIKQKVLGNPNIKIFPKPQTALQLEKLLKEKNWYQLLNTADLIINAPNIAFALKNKAFFYKGIANLYLGNTRQAYLDIQRCNSLNIGSLKLKTQILLTLSLIHQMTNDKAGAKALFSTAKHIIEKQNKNIPYLNQTLNFQSLLKIFELI